MHRLIFFILVIHIKDHHNITIVIFFCIVNKSILLYKIHNTKPFFNWNCLPAWFGVMVLTYTPHCTTAQLAKCPTGILIYWSRSVSTHSPMSQANVKLFHSKPTRVTSKLKHDVTVCRRIPFLDYSTYATAPDQWCYPKSMGYLRVEKAIN